MIVKILSIQPQTKNTGFIKEEYEVRIIIVGNPRDAKIYVFFLPNVHAQMNELKYFLWKAIFNKTL